MYTVMITITLKVWYFTSGLEQDNGFLLLSHVREQCRKHNGALKAVVTMYY